jgi:hypothetical protein
MIGARGIVLQQPRNDRKCYNEQVKRTSSFFVCSICAGLETRCSSMVSPEFHVSLYSELPLLYLKRITFPYYGASSCKYQFLSTCSIADLLSRVDKIIQLHNWYSVVIRKCSRNFKSQWFKFIYLQRQIF